MMPELVDTLMVVADTLAQAVPICAADLFGASSQLCGGGEAVGGVGVASEGVRDLVVVVLMVLYMLLLYRWLLSRRRHVDDDAYSVVKMSSESGSSGLYLGDYLLTYFMVVVAVVSIGGPLLFGGLFGWSGVLMLAATSHLVFALSAGVLWVACYLCYNEGLFYDVMELKVRYFVRIALWSLPLSLVAGVVGNLNALLYCAGIQFVVALCGYVFTSWRLFVSKKISNLNWILYLCTVELLPVVLLWTILTRSLV